jgi:Protein of unknown function (DUF559)
MRDWAEIDVAISEVARRQHGNIHVKQLNALGLGKQAIWYRVKQGRLYPVFRGVYSVGRPATTPLERASAAVLACGPRGALGHFSGLASWAFARDWPWTPEVSIVGDRRPPGIVVHRTLHLPRRDIRIQQGIRVTSPARTLLDCAPRLGAKRRKRIVNEALHTPFVSRSQLAEVIERYPTHPGAKLLRPFVDTTDGPTRSGWEDEFPSFCEQFGLPRPQINTIVGGYEVDAYFEAERLIVELDGYEFHSDRQAFEADRERDAEMLAAGRATVRVTWERIEHRSAREAERLRTILAQRRRRGRP